MDLTVTYGGNGANIESLALVWDLAGPVDTVVPGPPVADKIKGPQYIVSLRASGASFRNNFV